MKQSSQPQPCHPTLDLLLELLDLSSDLINRTRRFVGVKLAGEGNLDTHLGLGVVDPCVGDVGVNFPDQVGLG
ncbi:hypothetical protein ACFFX0_25720 [Citricoccus parietis]|uniref:Uncharacterized protein n=1 Tax=Citricoccus parietis TaxID=592307 RepID=A0ABV5G704_9MICC